VRRPQSGPFASRREFLLGGGALLLAGRVRAAIPLRIAAIDWAMLETLLALGLTPVAATELIQFRSDAVEPAIPPDVVDLGLRGSPNFELLHLLRPDLILISPFYVRHEAALSGIAPILSLPFYVRGEPPFEKALAAVQVLGERLGRAEKAESVLHDVAAQIDAYRQALAPFADRPTYLVNIGDARHVRVFGFDSMFGYMLARLGLPNAWADRSRFTFAAPVPIENLAQERDARIVIVSDVPVEARSGLRSSIIWNSLEPVRQGRVIRLANVNPYGGVAAGLRFARLLTEALQAEGQRG
jgi:ABC-type Fe3+-hydroxamate transport system substrate-binding protein